MEKRIKILVVDDEDIIRNFLKRTIEKEFGKQNVEVIFADNAKRGAEKAISEKPDIIIMDYDMPHMSGIESILQIRAHDTETPIIGLSADGTLEQIFKSAGANEFAIKEIKYLPGLMLTIKGLTEK